MAAVADRGQASATRLQRRYRNPRQNSLHRLYPRRIGRFDADDGSSTKTELTVSRAGRHAYLPPSISRLIRARRTRDRREIRRLVKFVSAQSTPAFGTAMHEKAPISGGTLFHFLETDSAYGLIEHTASSSRSRCIAISDFFQSPLHTLTCLLH